MHLELSIALNFIISYLYNKLPRRRVDMFCEELEKGLRRKFEGHWYPEEPFKGSGFRSIKLSNEKIDPVLDMAAQLSGLSISEILEYLPKGLTLWIDPNEVSYRIGENGTVKILYYNRKSGVEDFALERNGSHELQSGQGFNPRADSFLPNDQRLPATLNGLSISPSTTGSWIAGTNGGCPTPSSNTNNSTSPVNSFRPRPSTSTCFTAAAFAQTKFGSTKMKTQAQRPTRLSPTELGGSFPSVASKHSPISPLGPAALWPGLNPCIAASPTSNVNLIQLSPVQSFPQFIGLCDSRLDILKEQQHCLLLLHQQQQQQQQQQKMRLHMSMSQGSLLPSNVASLSSSSRAEEGITTSLTSPQSFYDHQSLQQQQQQPLFLQSCSTVTNPKNPSPVPVSIPSASDSLSFGQALQMNPSADILLRPRDEVAMGSRNFQQDNNSLSQATTPDDFDWGSLINPYTNLSHLLPVAN